MSHESSSQEPEEAEEAEGTPRTSKASKTSKEDLNSDANIRNFAPGALQDQ